MSKNSNGNNPNTLPTPVTPQMPVPMPRSKAQDFRDGAAAINETAQTAYGIFSGMQDRQERQLKELYGQVNELTLQYVDIVKRMQRYGGGEK